MPRRLAALTFTNVTPLWTGGPLGGATYNIIGDHVVGPWLPDAKAIIGRVRWLLRAAEASAHARAGHTPQSLKEVDMIASRIFGHTTGNDGQASKIIVRVHVQPDPELLPQNGCTKCYVPVKPKLYNSLIGLARRLSSLPKKIRSDLGSMLEVDAFVLMRKRLGIPAARPLLSKKGSAKYRKYREELARQIGELPPGMLLLATIPRVRLLLQGAENVAKIMTHQPLPPRTVRLRVELYERTGSGLSPREAQLAVVAVAYTLAFLGVGKAVSRGFGRFFLEEPPVVEERVKDVEGILKWFLRLSDPDTAANVFSGTGRWIVEQTCRLLGFGGGCSSLPQQPPLLRVPSLDVAISAASVVKKLVHPCPYALQELVHKGPGCCDEQRRYVRDIHDALSAVGRAAMKVIWKLCSKVDVTSPGPGYHTWVLGLPRQGRASIRGCGEITTGYQVADEDLWALDEDCYACHRGGFGEARRASPLLVTSYCSGRQCYALLEPFMTLDDFVELLRGPQPLVHIGVHGLRQGSPLIHVVGVYRAATRSVLGANQCPQDHGGVVYPPPIGARQPPTDPKEVVMEAFTASVEWLRHLLSP